MAVGKKNRGLLSGDMSRGFSLVELMSVIVIVSILMATASYTLMVMRKKACITVARYDLKKFFEAEHAYLIDHEDFKGEMGDIISNAPGVESTFSLEGYSPSQNTYITIINTDPFTAEARQSGLDIVFECDIRTGVIRER